MTKEREALRLADEIEGGWTRESGQKAALKLRRLHKVNQELLKALECVIDDLMYKDHARVIDIARSAIAKATGEQA